MTIHALLEKFRLDAIFNRDLGDRFENLIVSRSLFAELLGQPGGAVPRLG